VQPVGEHAILDGGVDARFDDNRNRPVLAQTFRAANGGIFTVAVNHLKSKGSPCDEDGDKANDSCFPCDHEEADGINEVGARAASLFDLSRPDLDWVAMAAAQGVPGARADSCESFAAALGAALAADGPYLIEALV